MKLPAKYFCCLPCLTAAGARVSILHRRNVAEHDAAVNHTGAITACRRQNNHAVVCAVPVVGGWMIVMVVVGGRVAVHHGRAAVDNATDTAKPVLITGAVPVYKSQLV